MLLVVALNYHLKSRGGTSRRANGPQERQKDYVRSPHSPWGMYIAYLRLSSRRHPFFRRRAANSLCTARDRLHDVDVELNAAPPPPPPPPAAPFSARQDTRSFAVRAVLIRPRMKLPPPLLSFSSPCSLVTSTRFHFPVTVAPRFVSSPFRRSLCRRLCVSRIPIKKKTEDPVFETGAKNHGRSISRDVSSSISPS